MTVNFSQALTQEEYRIRRRALEDLAVKCKVELWIVSRYGLEKKAGPAFVITFYVTGIRIRLEGDESNLQSFLTALKDRKES
jgi:hypothetical protein